MLSVSVFINKKKLLPALSLTVVAKKSSTVVAILSWVAAGT
jgi:hypothetical protein